MCFFCRNTSKSEKRPLGNENAEEYSIENVEKSKKQRLDESVKATESILDDIRLEEIESRISVHVIESPDACTHECAVYPGNQISFTFFNCLLELY